MECFTPQSRSPIYWILTPTCIILCIHSNLPRLGHNWADFYHGVKTFPLPFSCFTTAATTVSHWILIQWVHTSFMLHILSQMIAPHIWLDLAKLCQMPKVCHRFKKTYSLTKCHLWTGEGESFRLQQWSFHHNGNLMNCQGSWKRSPNTFLPSCMRGQVETWRVQVDATNCPTQDLTAWEGELSHITSEENIRRILDHKRKVIRYLSSPCANTLDIYNVWQGPRGSIKRSGTCLVEKLRMSP